MEKKKTHLEMLQGIINRLSHNSFLLKGWSVVLISAFFALGANNTKVFFIYLAYFPAIAFWVLDGYFLHQERLFRALYNRVRVLEEENIDFSMDTTIVNNEVDIWPRIIFSKTLLIFHGTVFASILIAVLIVNYLTKVGT
jgi:hypothetical protein